MIQYKMIGPSTTATHLTCALCSFTSFSLKQFSHHLWTEHLVTIANYKCPYCLFITYTQRSLKFHFQSVHKCKKNKIWCHYFINWFLCFRISNNDVNYAFLSGVRFSGLEHKNSDNTHERSTRSTCYGHRTNPIMVRIKRLYYKHTYFIAYNLSLS